MLRRSKNQKKSYNPFLDIQHKSYPGISERYSHYIFQLEFTRAFYCIQFAYPTAHSNTLIKHLIQDVALFPGSPYVMFELPFLIKHYYKYEHHLISAREHQINVRS